MKLVLLGLILILLTGCEDEDKKEPYHVSQDGIERQQQPSGE